MVLDFLIVIFVCQLLGEVIVRAADVPIPGPVIGMALLFAFLALRGGVPDGLKDTAGFLLDHLALLFVPAGVGVLVHLPLLVDEGPAIVAALIGSTVLTIAVTGIVMSMFGRRASSTQDGDR